MARYTGPKSKISRKYGEPIFGDTKALEKNHTLQVSMGEGGEEKNLNTLYSLLRSKKQSTYMVF